MRSSYLPAGITAFTRATPMPAYLVLLQVEIARFTRRFGLPRSTAHRRLVSVALILTSRWMGVTHYLCSTEPGLSSRSIFGYRRLSDPLPP